MPFIRFSAAKSRENAFNQNLNIVIIDVSNNNGSSSGTSEMLSSVQSMNGSGISDLLFYDEKSGAINVVTGSRKGFNGGYSTGI